VLGEEQWLWLEKQLLDGVRVGMTVIGSGIQVLNDWKPSENWGRFPSERTRLLRLLSDTNTSNVLFISGDVHFAEFTEVECSGGNRKLVDFTSSGLTHSLDEEVNQFMRPLVPTPTSIPSKTKPQASITTFSQASSQLSNLTFIKCIPVPKLFASFPL
jgi:hypothetical protein